MFVFVLHCGTFCSVWEHCKNSGFSIDIRFQTLWWIVQKIIQKFFVFFWLQHCISVALFQMNWRNSNTVQNIVLRNDFCSFFTQALFCCWRSELLRPDRTFLLIKKTLSAFAFVSSNSLNLVVGLLKTSEHHCLQVIQLTAFQNYESQIENITCFAQLKAKNSFSFLIIKCFK